MNSVHTDTNFCARPSTVAKAIFEKGGTYFQNKLVQKTSGRMEYGHIAVTEGGGKLCIMLVLTRHQPAKRR